MTNPLLSKQSPASPRNSNWMQSYCTRMNAKRFVRESGWVYFVNRRRHDDGTVEEFIDKKEEPLRLSSEMVKQAGFGGNR